MEYRTLEINVVSAKDIKNVNLLSKMKVYAVVSISGDPQNPQKTKTHVHRDGGTNPTWNFPVKFTVNESLAHQNRLYLEIKLISDRNLAGDTLIGTVNIPVKELMDNPGDGSFCHVSYHVRTQSGKDKGSLNLSYKFGEKFTAPAKAAPSRTPMAYPPTPGSKQEPVMAYPATVGSSVTPPYGVAPPHQYGYGYPPAQQSSYGYPPAQQPGYGYPSQHGYGYPPAQRKKNRFGMGMGAGLLGGALGGLLIGDMVSDAADYGAGYDGGYDDAGYDAGFDGGGGFDF
ncbi:hypothetical protein TanjilG_21419 [Lupinus angustifolius]|uniref:C2 domain-containing protein n=1 Tax=Lupinus angustifolius TaxID=3871 RepID=A0A4P1RNI9_LUPAN|nr:PREDICTED: protein SRC2-like [Lupinus angustifolius]OIW14279.1 hypothetical protein TanjilG_21419 [Lupinus angustifolius]